MTIVVLGNTSQKEELTKEPGTSSALVWVAEPEALVKSAKTAEVKACIDLIFDGSEERIKLLRKLTSQTIIINDVVNPLNESTSGFIRFNGWNTFLNRTIAEASCNDSLLKEEAERVFISIGKKTQWVPDIAGFISSRVIASIINEAYFTLEEQVSSKEEIDTAMKLGTNYPYGPFEWCKKIGIKNVFALLSRLAKEEKIYEPATLLTR